jgi:uncharacterized protein (DUF2235 family)
MNVPEEQKPHRRLALFLDGTWNTVSDNTNVWRMKSLCDANDEQLVYYSAGVGTMFGQRLDGGMFGYGLDDEVIRAYEWLIDNYRPEDQLFIFGFSRGAFTARSLAGFISTCGLLEAGAPLSVAQLYDRYRKRNSVQVATIRHLKQQDPKTLKTEERWMVEYSIAIPTWLVGVWDTVGALGVPFGHIKFISRSNYAFLDTDIHINDAHAYHAVAIDEHRKAFAPTLWQAKRKKVPHPDDWPQPRLLAAVEQRWFIGAHANVGGGCTDDLLAQIPLRWLMTKAACHGLTFKKQVVVDGDEAASSISDSYREFAYGIYHHVSRSFHREIAVTPAEVSADEVYGTINETIDGSVFDRWRADPKYRPTNLVDWAKKYAADPATLRTTVLAHDPKQAVPEDPWPAAPAQTLPAADTQPTPGPNPSTTARP